MSDRDSADPAHWIAHARDDLMVARRMSSDPATPPRYACWNAQQAVEKALKATLLALEISYPKRHDLEALAELLPGDWTVKAHQAALAELTQWAMESRYPGAWPEPDAAEAQQALAVAEAAIEAILQDLRSHDFDYEAADD